VAPVIAADRFVHSSNSIGRRPELTLSALDAVYRRERQLPDTCPRRAHVDCVPRSGSSPRTQILRGALPA
jgi:hypothetical protein